MEDYIPEGITRYGMCTEILSAGIFHCCRLYAVFFGKQTSSLNTTFNQCKEQPECENLKGIQISKIKLCTLGKEET